MLKGLVKSNMRQQLQHCQLLVCNSLCPPSCCSDVTSQQLDLWPCSLNFDLTGPTVRYFLLPFACNDKLTLQLEHAIW